MAKSRSFLLKHNSGIGLNAVLPYLEALHFVRSCASEFHSDDVVMDVGCGPEMYCCKAVLEVFPQVKSLIAVDSEQRLQNAERTDIIMPFIGNIQERDSLEYYEGKISKVFSMNVVHEIKDKELAFQNVYRLLKCGGEAAFSFCVESKGNKFIKAMLEVPKYKKLFQDSFDENFYPNECRKQYYKEMLERVGFHDVRANEERKTLPYSTDEQCKEVLSKTLKKYFKVPREKEDEFIDEAFQIYVKIDSIADGKPYYHSLILTLFGVKPVESMDLKAMETSDA
ncbi:hypothetical protein NPIL_170091 [Nephila pilipes]|uniref:Methyltransferase domain-containing protein n=1 Tax=Nephila pilipes TaxID=299642 RepID=A0A8X6MC76_NEPPI|nr:hypothetical protein NPIL_170091 [Nephila pilipes]